MKQNFTFKHITNSLPWNLWLLCAGSFLYVIGYNGIARQHEFIPGGLYGLAVLIYNGTGMFTVASLYAVFNVPIFVLALHGVSRRFFMLNLFCMAVIAWLTSALQVDFAIQDRLHAAIASGALMGAGCGVILRSSGAGGGLDVLAVMLNQRYGIRFGLFYFVVNVLLMLAAATRIEPDLVVSSIVMQCICSVVTEYILSLFNQRKSMWIISSKTEEISRRIADETPLSGTIIRGRGAYSGKEIDMLYSIAHNFHIKTIEDIVYDIDPDAIFVVENTFTVFGGNIASRKKY